MKTFYLYDENGEELEAINPVERFEETDRYWEVDNGYSIYAYTRESGWTYEIRTTEDEVRDVLKEFLSDQPHKVERIISALAARPLGLFEEES